MVTEVQNCDGQNITQQTLTMQICSLLTVVKKSCKKHSKRYHSSLLLNCGICSKKAFKHSNASTLQCISAVSLVFKGAQI